MHWMFDIIRLTSPLFEPNKFVLIHTGSHGAPPCPGWKIGKATHDIKKAIPTTYIRDAPRSGGCLAAWLLGCLQPRNSALTTFDRIC